MGDNETKSVESERTAPKMISKTATEAAPPCHSEVRLALLTPKQGPHVSSDKKARVSEKGHPESEIGEKSVGNKVEATIKKNEQSKSETYQDTNGNTGLDGSDTSEYQLESDKDEIPEARTEENTPSIANRKKRGATFSPDKYKEVMKQLREDRSKQERPTPTLI